MGIYNFSVFSFYNKIWLAYLDDRENVSEFANRIYEIQEIFLTSGTGKYAYVTGCCCIYVLLYINIHTAE